MAYDIHQDGIAIGRVVRCAGRNVYAYAADGAVIGCFADVDAAVVALSAHASRNVEAVAA